MKKSFLNRCRHSVNKARLFTLLLLGVVSLSVQAQRKKITIQWPHATIRELIAEIERQTSYLFVYNSAEIDLNRSIRIETTRETVEQVLTHALHGTDISYTIKERNIMLINQAKEGMEELNAHLPLTIRGVVREPSGEPLIGVTVQDKVTHATVFTDINGGFVLKVDREKAMLTFSYLGYHVEECVAEKSKTMHVVLQENVKLLDEVVVTGYMTQKRGLLTGAITTMDVSADRARMPVTSAGEILAGQMAGVSVSTSSGVPGENPTIRIRTKSTWRTDDESKALFVIDGIVRSDEDFYNLSPNEIENVTVLKDAASAAVYGSRAANGVILVTTKRGRVDKPRFNYAYSIGIDKRQGNAERTSGVETAEMYNRVQGQGDWWWSEEEIAYIKTINNGWGYDQLGIVWEDPIRQNHNFSVTGGSEIVRYFAGVSYAESSSFLKSLDYRKNNFRLNMTLDLTKHIELFMGISLTESRTNEMAFEGTELYKKLLLWQPDQPIYTDGGQYADYGWLSNVGGEVNGAGGYRVSNHLKPSMQFTMNYNAPFLEGLSFKIGYAQSWTNNRLREYRQNFNMAILKTEGANGHIFRTEDELVTGYRKTSNYPDDFLLENARWNSDYQLNAQAGYDRTFAGLHKVQGVLAFEKSEWSQGGVQGQINNFPYYNTDQFWAGSNLPGDMLVSRSDAFTTSDSGRISFIGQFTYAYGVKYLASFSFREDGSMKFHKDHRWGFFPAASLGWVLSEEPFFKPSSINFLKIRGTVGLTGNDNVGSFQWQESYKEGNSAHFGKDPSEQAGITYDKVVNPAITWEKTLNYNLGVDVGFLHHWEASLEYWFSRTYDILGEIGASLPTTYGREMPDENYGIVHAQGFDFTLGYKNQIGAWNYYANLNLSYGWNRVMRSSYAENAKWYEIPVGKSLSRITGYRYAGIIRSEEELNQFVIHNPDYRFNGIQPEVGAMIYEDISGPNGTPDGIIDSWDKEILLANNFPIVYGLNLGVSWKRLSIHATFNGKLGEQKSFRDLAEGVDHNRMWRAWYTNSWTEENPHATLPKRVNTNSTYKEESLFWYAKNNFIRLKNITVSYDLPQWMTGQLLEGAKLFFTGTNLFTIDSFNKYDPELGEGFDFPIMSSYNFGINLYF